MSEPSANAEPFKPLDMVTLSLRRDERGRLIADRDGQSIVVTARRAFPWSDPTAFISLRDKDGNELVLIEQIDLIPAASREVLRAALGDGTFVPKILRIADLDLEHGYQLWTVETEAGPAELRVQEREDIRFLSESRFSVKDATGNVYEIADESTLDPHSQRMLARVI